MRSFSSAISSACLPRHAGAAALPEARIAEGLPHAVAELPLLVGEPLAFFHQILYATLRLLLPKALQHVARLLEPFGGAARLRFALGRSVGLRSLCLAHIFERLLEPVDRLPELLVTRETLAALALLASLAGLLPLLPLLPLLTLLPLLALLCLLALLSLLALLHLGLRRGVPRKLLDLPLQLLGLAAEHLLLPALLRCLLSAPLLLGEFLLAARKLLQLLECFVDLLLAVSRRSALLACFVLVLLGVELQVEQAFEVARAIRASTATTTPAIAERHLNLAERSFGAQKVLEGLLLGAERVGPLLAVELGAGGAHRLHGLLHVFHEALERRAGAGQLAAASTVHQRLRLIAQLGLHSREELGIFGGRGLVAGLILHLVPGGRNDLLLPRRDLVALIVVAASPAAAPTHLGL